MWKQNYLLIVLLFVTLPFLLSAQEEKKRPNIVVIMADDVGCGDLPMYFNNEGLISMPNLKRFSQLGLTFKDAHSTPLCSPSRYSFLSGNYQHRGRKAQGTWDVLTGHNQFQKHQKSIAEALRDKAGYNTATFGKYHIGGQIPFAEGHSSQNSTHKLTHVGYDWTKPFIEGPSDIGFNTSFVTPNGIQDSPYAFIRDGYLSFDATESKFWTRGEHSQQYGTSKIQRKGEGSQDWDSSAYNMIVVNETEKFIDQHIGSGADNPFFVYAALGAVHGPHSPPDFYLDGTPIAGRYLTEHADMLFELDKAVGSIVTMIEERGLSDNTLFIFLSDNGGVKTSNGSSSYGHNSHGPLRGYKGTVYEGGHRVPLLFRWDNELPAGEERNNLVSITDIYDTICQLVGIKKPLQSAQDSISFANHLYSSVNKKGLRKQLGTWVYENGFVAAEALRIKNMKLVIHHDLQTGKRTTEIFNLLQDISETTNIINDMNKKKARRMIRKLRAHGPCPNKDHKKIFKLVESLGTLSANCTFFQEKRKRCDWYIEGEVKCPSVCKSRFSSMCDSVYG